MICKKCGATIADTSKFCGYCGNAVEQPVIIQPVQDTSFNAVPNSQENTVQTVVPNVGESSIPNVVPNPVPVTPVEQPVQVVPNIGENTVQPVVSNVVESSTPNVVPNPVSVTPVEQPVVQNVIPNVDTNTLNTVQNNVQPIELEQTNQVANPSGLGVNPLESVSNGVPNPVPVNTLEQTNEDVTQVLPPMPDQTQLETNTQVQPQNTGKSKKSGLKFLPIILGVIAVIAAAIVAVMAFSNNRSSDTALTVLKKSLGNFEQKASNSATVNANILIESTTNDTINFSAIMKYAKNGDIYDVSIKLNESLLFDEMNLYSRIDRENMNLYAQSSIIDLLGFTNSEEDLWINYPISLDDFKITDNNELNIIDILDDEHFKYVDSTNGVSHYKLILDKKLLDNNKDQLTEEQVTELEDLLSSVDVDNYTIDLYINDSNELVKISMEISNIEGIEGLSRIVVSIEFSGLNSTVVEISNDALNSSVNLEDYMANYAIENSEDDYTENDNDFDVNYDF